MDSTSPTTTLSPDVLDNLRDILGDDRIFRGEDTEKYSKDFYWYSPVLKKELADKRADVALLIRSIDELRQVVSLLYKARVPITLRGGGTGNYGQLIPLYGGAVLDLSGMNAIHGLDGVVRAEVGATLREIETRAREIGWELRCMPSTWMIASIGGFLCGGSGGIGSIRYGGIASGDNVKSVTLMTVEAEPRLLRFEERDAIKALHTYGTTGIMVEVEMRLGDARDWRQLIINGGDWDALLDWTHRIAADDAITKRLVTQFEDPVPQYFKPLRKHIPEGSHSTFLMVDAEDVDTVLASAAGAGLEHVYTKAFGNPPKPPFITDYTWNHTTLWAIKADASITYLQCGFGTDFAGNLRKLKERFGDEFLMHLEMTLGNSKFPTSKPGVSVGGIPLIRYTTEERLNEIIDFCESIGVSVANPHTCVLEDGGRHEDIAEKHALKDEADPAALLNPGKMRTYPKNPFAASKAS